jgi:hypothetical protein
MKSKRDHSAALASPCADAVVLYQKGKTGIIDRSAGFKSWLYLGEVQILHFEDQDGNSPKHCEDLVCEALRKQPAASGRGKGTVIKLSAKHVY